MFARQTGPQERHWKAIPISGIIRRKCACGGGAPLSSECEECGSGLSHVMQRKLAVGTADHPLEREAEATADQVMMALGHQALGVLPPRIQRFVGPGIGEPEGWAPKSVDRALAAPGRPLDPVLRRDMEPRFGYDFSRVRIHDNAAAHRSAQEVNADAYTVGSDIVFGAGRYSPASLQGRRLLAHELTHVIQQTGGSGAVTGPAPGMLLQRAPNPLNMATIDELRKRAVTDPAAAEELWRRFSAMTNTQLERYARNDPMAQSIYAQRTVPPRAAVGQGRFSRPEVEGPLTQALAKARAEGPQRVTATSVTPDMETEGGTMGVARTDVPGLDDVIIVGKSPRAGGQVNSNSEFAPPTDPKILPHTHGHAEQAIADRLDLFLRSVAREKLIGRRVWILIEQEPCSTCAQGVVDPKVSPGVLKKLANKYPELAFEIKNLNTSGRIVIEGRPVPSVNRQNVPPATFRARPAAPPEAAAPPLPIPSADTPEIPTPKLGTPKGVGPRTAASEVHAPRTPEAAELPRVPTPLVPERVAPTAAVPEIPTPRTGSGVRAPSIRPRLGSLAAGVALEVLNIGLLLVDLIIQLVIVPYLERIQRKLEESYRKQLSKQIQRYYETNLQPDVDRAMYCALPPIRAIEQSGKQPHVTVSLKVKFGDTSNRFFDNEPPESIFDLFFHSMSIEAATIDDKETPKSSTPLKRSEEKGWTLLSGRYTLFEQTITFSFAAPKSEEIAAQFGGQTPPSCSCFIATACWGTPFAPEVVFLRHYRDRKLRRTLAGRWLIAAYYAVSPPIARWIERRPGARRIVRERALAPLVGLMRRRRWVEDDFPSDYPSLDDLRPRVPAVGRSPSVRERVERLRRYRRMLARSRPAPAQRREPAA